MVCERGVCIGRCKYIQHLEKSNSAPRCKLRGIYLKSDC